MANELYSEPKITATIKNLYSKAVVFVGQNKEYTFFKQSGFPIVGIQNRAWREICQKTK